jgi:broad specificity phosphatase PhoE
MTYHEGLDIQDTPAPTLVYLVRHGLTDWNRERRFQGHLDVYLSPEGLAQAQALADWLTPPPHRFSAIYTSDLARARQTAQIIGHALGLQPVLAPPLREIHCGDWQGLSVAEIEERYPGKLKEWHDSIQSFTLPGAGGESIPQVQARIYSFYKDVVRRHSGQAIILASHGVALSALQAAIFGWDLQETWATSRARLGNTGVTAISVDASTGQPTLLLANSSAHLPEPTGIRSVLDQSA